MLVNAFKRLLGADPRLGLRFLSRSYNRAGRM